MSEIENRSNIVDSQESFEDDNLSSPELNDIEEYLEFLRSVQVDPTQGEDFTVQNEEEDEDEEEEYQPPEEEEDDKDNKDEDDSEDEDMDEVDELDTKVPKKELQQLVSGCWETIVGEVPVIPQSGNSPSDVSIDDVNTTNNKHTLERSQNTFTLSQESKDHDKNQTIPTNSLHGNKNNELLLGGQSVVSSVVEQLLSGGNPSDICIEGMPISCIRKLVARQMTMASQLLTQLLLMVDTNSPTFTQCYTTFMELSNLREQALKKAALVQMNVEIARSVQHYNFDTKGKLRSSSVMQAKSMQHPFHSNHSNFQHPNPRCRIYSQSRQGEETGLLYPNRAWIQPKPCLPYPSSSPIPSTISSDNSSDNHHLTNRLLTRSGILSNGLSQSNPILALNSDYRYNPRLNNKPKESKESKETHRRLIKTAFDVPLLVKIQSLFEHIDISRRKILETFQIFQNRQEKFSFLTNHRNVNDSNYHVCDDKNLDHLIKLKLTQNETMEIMKGMEARTWHCLFPTTQYPLQSTIVFQMNPTSLSGKTFFTPAEDDLLLHGVMELSETATTHWMKIKSFFLPSKEIQLLKFRYSQMVSSNPSEIILNSFTCYQQLKKFRLHKERVWSHLEDLNLLKGFQSFGQKWPFITSFFLPNRKRVEVKRRWKIIQKVWQRAFPTKVNRYTPELSPTIRHFLRELFYPTVHLNDPGMTGMMKEEEMERNDQGAVKSEQAYPRIGPMMSRHYGNQLTSAVLSNDLDGNALHEDDDDLDMEQVYKDHRYSKKNPNKDSLRLDPNFVVPPNRYGSMNPPTKRLPITQDVPSRYHPMSQPPLFQPSQSLHGVLSTTHMQQQRFPHVIDSVGLSTLKRGLPVNTHNALVANGLPTNQHSDDGLYGLQLPKYVDSQSNWHDKLQLSQPFHPLSQTYSEAATPYAPSMRSQTQHMYTNKLSQNNVLPIPQCVVIVGDKKEIPNFSTAHQSILIQKDLQSSMECEKRSSQLLLNEESNACAEALLSTKKAELIYSVPSVKSTKPPPVQSKRKKKELNDHDIQAVHSDLNDFKSHSVDPPPLENSELLFHQEFSLFGGGNSNLFSFDLENESRGGGHDLFRSAMIRTPSPIKSSTTNSDGRISPDYSGTKKLIMNEKVPKKKRKSTVSKSSRSKKDMDQQVDQSSSVLIPKKQPYKRRKVNEKNSKSEYRKMASKDIQEKNYDISSDNYIDMSSLPTMPPKNGYLNSPSICISKYMVDVSTVGHFEQSNVNGDGNFSNLSQMISLLKPATRNSPSNDLTMKSSSQENISQNTDNRLFANVMANSNKTWS